MPQPPHPHAATVIIEMGTSGHYLITNPSPLHAVCPAINPIMVQLLNSSTIVSMHITTILLPHLPSTAGHTHIFPNLVSHSLISVGQLCNHGCEALFTADHMVISRMGNLSSQAAEALTDFGHHLLNLLTTSLCKPTLYMTTCQCQP